MAHPYKDAAHKNDPKWAEGLSRYADGGAVLGDVLRDPNNQRRAAAGLTIDPYRRNYDAPMAGDLQTAQKISDAVPRRPEGRKRGGRANKEKK